MDGYSSPEAAAEVAAIREALLRRWREYDGSEEFWAELRADLDCGRTPHPEALRKALRSGKPVPEWAADYIADRLAGKKLARARPRYSLVGLTHEEHLKFFPDSGEHIRLGKSAYIWWRFRRWERVYRHPRYARERQRKHRLRYGLGRKLPRENPRMMALNKVAEEFQITVRSVENYLAILRK
jgi:hypothetical protein